MSITPVTSLFGKYVRPIYPFLATRRKWVALGVYSGVATVALLVLFGAAAAEAEKVALQGARILSPGQDAIDNGTVLIENGKIVAVGGEDLELPFDATVVDVTGKTLFPGMILAHAASGMDVPNENLPVTPFVDVF